MSSKQSVLFLIVLSFPVLLIGQKPIKGIVKDRNGEVISFATIQNLSTKRGVVADDDGQFTLTNVSENDKLKISAVGYQLQEILVEKTNFSSGLQCKLEKDNIGLESVVCTGSIKPTPVDSSIYKVKLIPLAKIEESGSVNLSDLLINEANIRITNDGVLGAEVEMLGMSGPNVKIMIDGVPIIGRMGGNLDLNQINIDNIAQVEVIEGPMSVVYGNNALAGTINLISKQPGKDQINIGVKGYAESKDRYSGNVNVSIGKKRHALALEGGYENFQGVDFNENDRSMDWKPKSFYRGSVGYSYTRNAWRFHLHGGLYSDELWVKSNLVEGYKAFDSYFFTERYDVSGGFTGAWNENNNLDLLVSYNIHDRSEQSIDKNMLTLEETKYPKESSQKTVQQMMRLTYGHGFSKKLSFQTGFDMNVETMTDDERVEGKEQSIGDYAGFLNVNYIPFKGFEFQPGLRYAHNSDYNAPLVYSLNTKWYLSDCLTWRASFSKGFRAPAVKELYYVFVDTNHKIHGNSELNAESSNSYNTTFEYNKTLGKDRIVVNLSGYYNDLTDKIDLVYNESDNSYYYSNIETYQTIGTDVEMKYYLKNRLQLRAGYGITGRYNYYTEQNEGSKFNLSNDWFGGVKWTDPLMCIIWNIDYKYNGEKPYLYTDNDSQIIEGNQEGYSTLNASLTKRFDKTWLITGGAKNLFDVTNVKMNGSNSGSAHSGGDSNPVLYGRTFYITLSYQFHK